MVGGVACRFLLVANINFANDEQGVGEEPAVNVVDDIVTVARVTSGWVSAPSRDGGEEEEEARPTPANQAEEAIGLGTPTSLELNKVGVTSRRCVVCVLTVAKGCFTSSLMDCIILRFRGGSGVVWAAAAATGTPPW